MIQQQRITLEKGNQKENKKLTAKLQPSILADNQKKKEKQPNFGKKNPTYRIQLQ
jgi:hypothetical protein